MNRLLPTSLRLLVLTAAVACSLTAAAQELAKREQVPGLGFSLQVPEGFKATKDEEKGALSCTRERDRATFEAREVEYDGELTTLAKAASDAMKRDLVDYKLLKQTEFSLKSGLSGLKLHLEMRPAKDGPVVRQMLYFFEGRAGYKCFVTCGAMAKDDLKLHPLWEKVVGSVVVRW